MPHFNYTGKKKIRSKDVVIITSTVEGSLTVSVDVSLERYHLPDDGALFLEAYRQNSWMRISLGTMETFDSDQTYELSEFNDSGGILFRLKVTEMELDSDSENGSRRGKILALADKIQPLAEDGSSNGRDCILSVRTVEMSAIWRLDLDNVAYPILCLNKDAGSKISLAHSWHFITMVYPALVREILTKIVDNRVHGWFDDDESWEYKWYSFARSVDGVYEMPHLHNSVCNDEVYRDIKDWVNDAVEAFAKSKDVLGNFRKLIVTED